MAQAVADVVEQLSELPPFPKVTTKLIQLMEDPSASIESVAEVISSDPSLVLKVIHVANSPFYMCSREITSVKDAVLVLGITTIKSITTAISLQKGLSRFRPRPDIFDQYRFWAHSYATAIAAGKIMKAQCRCVADRYYLAGLIHDLGKLIHASFWPESWATVINRLKTVGGSYEASEMITFNLSHRELTTLLCRNWGLPDHLLVALDPNGPALAESDCVTGETDVLWTANAVADEAGYRFPPEERADYSAIDLEPLGEIVGSLEADVNHQLATLES